MSQLTLETLEQRVAALEREVSQLVRPQTPPRFKDWRRAVGSFIAGELSEEVDRAGREIREADRQSTEP